MFRANGHGTRTKLHNVFGQGDGGTDVTALEPPRIRGTCLIDPHVGAYHSA